MQLEDDGTSVSFLKASPFIHRLFPLSRSWLCQEHIHVVLLTQNSSHTHTHTHQTRPLPLSGLLSPTAHTHTPSLLTPRRICNAAGTLSSVLAEWGRLGRLCSAFGTLSIYWLNKQSTRKQQGPVSWLSFFWDVLIPRRPDARLHSASASCLKAAVFGFNLWGKKKKQSEVMQKSCKRLW